MKASKIFIFLFVMSLMVASCGPSALSDQEFTGNAKGTCQALKAQIASLDGLDYDGKASAYRSAAAELDKLEITEESAPQAYRLRSSLVDLADAQDSFQVALHEAMANKGINSIRMLMMTESGNVTVSETGSILDITRLDIDKDIVINLSTQFQAVKDAATALGLEDCSPEKSANDE